MTGTRKCWKRYARKSLSGKWIVAIAAMLIVGFIQLVGMLLGTALFPGTSILATVAGEVFTFVVSLIVMIFSTGYCYLRLNMCRGREYNLSNIFYVFHNQPDRVLIAGFVVAIINIVAQIPFYLFINLFETEDYIVWSLSYLLVWCLTLLLNLILTIPFMLTFYLLADDAQMGAMDALKISVHKMKGHMWEYFKLKLSFIPLFIVAALPMGIGCIWMIPYMEFTDAVYYMYITGELDRELADKEIADNTPAVENAENFIDEKKSDIDNE